MKLSIVVFFLFFSYTGYSTTDSLKKQNITLKAIRYSSAFLAGFCDGTKDAISFHYGSFQKVHPQANPQFWNPQLSWVNKYKNGDPAQGEKYLGSSTVFVPFQDAWHGLKAGNTLFTIGSSIIIPIGQKKSWKFYAKEIAIGYICNRAGFYLSYNILYK